MKILIIGAKGFLGNALSSHLRKGGRDIEGWDVSSPETADGHLYRQVDVLKDTLSIDDGIDGVFYLAHSPFYHEFPNNGDHLFGVNTHSALKTALNAKMKNVKFFCYASSGSVYQNSFEPLSEISPLNRSNPYALSKIHAEEALALLDDGMKVFCVRPFGLFGPGQKSMLPRILFGLIKDRKPVVIQSRPADSGKQSDGLNLSFLFVEDAVKMLARLAEKAMKNEHLPKVLNLSGEHPVSIKRFASEIGKNIGISPSFAYSDTKRTFDLIADTKLLKQTLSPAFTPLETAMKITFGKAEIDEI